MLELIDLTYTYPKAKNAEALTDVSCRIGEGTWLLLGENGAGKTTLMRLAASLLRPTSGQVILDGENVTAHEASTLSRLFLLTDDMIFPAQTINEFASIHAPYYPTFSRELLEANLEEFGLTGKERIDRLSLGYRKRAQIAYTLALRAPLTMLDEPTNGLDIDARKKLRKLMSKSATDGQTIIVSTHNIADLETLYDGVIILHRGHLLTAMSAFDILSRLNFTSGTEIPEGALFSEWNLATVNAITENLSGEPQTDINYSLLYSALMSKDASQKIMSILNKAEK